MKKPADAYRDAIDELAAEFRSRQFPDKITADDAREYVDASVIADWLAAEGVGRDMEIILGDLCAQRLSTPEARSVLVALAIGNSDKVLSILQAALVEQVARDMAYESQKFNDNYCPTDSEMSRGVPYSYAAQVDDPVTRDLRHLARSFR